MKSRYLNKEILARANYLSREVLHYNRTLSDEFVNTLPDDINFPVIPLMVHEHKSGKACEPHMRVFVVVPKVVTGTIEEMSNGGFDQYIVDLEIGLFNLLPSIHDNSLTDPVVDAEPASA